ncbi:hypothetical protein K438DRAFT_1746744 [Mycena galopus ATCC 62051]|nr:hypothetical protein K438DRAFT_1746744 [Mycena galopus ATCC 62051]
MPTPFFVACTSPQAFHSPNATHIPENFMPMGIFINPGHARRKSPDQWSTMRRRDMCPTLVLTRGFYGRGGNHGCEEGQTPESCGARSDPWMNRINSTCKILVKFRKSSKNNLRAVSVIPSPRGSQIQLKASKKLFRGRCVGFYETSQRHELNMSAAGLPRRGHIAAVSQLKTAAAKICLPLSAAACGMTAAAKCKLPR